MIIMIEPIPQLKFNKKKFSDFDQQLVTKDMPEEEKSHIYVVGYTHTGDEEVTADNSKNVQIKLSEILEAAGGGEPGPSVAGSVIPVIKESATLESDGYKVVEQEGKKVVLFDINTLGRYIQIQEQDESVMNSEQIVNNAGEVVQAAILDVCFTGSLLGETIKLYLPDYGPSDSDTMTKAYALRLWKCDPRDSKDPFAANPEGGRIVLVSDPVRETPETQEDDSKSFYDWFVKFIILINGVTQDGLFEYIARTSEVVNIYDDDKLQ